MWQLNHVIFLTAKLGSKPCITVGKNSQSHSKTSSFMRMSCVRDGEPAGPRLSVHAFITPTWWIYPPSAVWRASCWHVMFFIFVWRTSRPSATTTSIVYWYVEVLFVIKKHSKMISISIFMFVSGILAVFNFVRFWQITPPRRTQVHAVAWICRSATTCISSTWRGRATFRRQCRPP